VVEGHYSIRIAAPADADAVTALLQASYPVPLAERYEAELLALAPPLMTKATLGCSLQALTMLRNSLMVDWSDVAAGRPSDPEAARFATLGLFRIGCPAASGGH
jgi:hypothetical protein